MAAAVAPELGSRRLRDRMRLLHSSSVDRWWACDVFDLEEDEIVAGELFCRPGACGRRDEGGSRASGSVVPSGEHRWLSRSVATLGDRPRPAVVAR